MVNAGILDGDLLIVDRALSPQDGDIVIAVLFGELAVKRVRKRRDRLLLEPENAAYPRGSAWHLAGPGTRRGSDDVDVGGWLTAMSATIGRPTRFNRLAIIWRNQ